MERSKKEAENIIARKEKDGSQLSSKLEDEQALVAKMQRAIKETQSRVEEMEEELEAERQARAKAERQRSDLARELEELGERLREQIEQTVGNLLKDSNANVICCTIIN